MTFETDFEIIKNLTEIQACSGNESKIREYIREFVELYCDKIEIDILLCPRILSVKTIGISFTLKPKETARNFISI